MPSTHSLSSVKGKGKAWQLARDDSDVQGDPDGSILPLEVVQTSNYNVAYTIPILVGTNLQNLSVQVDTGSSDLWIASTLCSTSVCTKTGGRLYNPGTATRTGETFSIQYLQGTVSGPIFWDQVSLGGYTISNQALAAADNVLSEPLSRDFVGVLGLALPLNSVIAGVITPVIGNMADGAAFTSNLFSITPASAAPAARFLSLSLSRPGSNEIPALLGIGRHPPEIVADPSKIRYANPVSEREGVLFWKANVRAITVYVDGVPKPISIGHSASGGIYPTATLDTGVPLILTTSAIANGIYGAIGINPGSNGQYYVPCTQPLNMTITLDNRPEIPLHPLDLTGEPSAQSSSTYCTGLIQAADQYLSDPSSAIGDMILGVPFLRNVYMVMAYDPPDNHGNFPVNRTTINPRLGLLNLTNPTIALEEFKRVRVDNQPINPTHSSPSPSSSPVANRKLSVGIDVLIGLVSFFVLCFVLFAGRWFFWKWLGGRRRRRANQHLEIEKPSMFSSYQLTRQTSGTGGGGGNGRENALPHLQYEPDLKMDRITSEYTTTDSARTRVDSDVVDDPDGELGYKNISHAADGDEIREDDEVAAAVLVVDPWETYVTSNDPALPLEPGGDDHVPALDSDVLPTVGLVSRFVRTPSWKDSGPDARAQKQQQQQRTPSISWPLLVHQPEHSHGSEEFGVESMAGIGTAARRSRIDADVRQGSISDLNNGGVLPAVAIPQESSRSRRVTGGPRPMLMHLPGDDQIFGS